MNCWIILAAAFASAWVFDSGVEYFSFDMKLKWYFPSDNEVEFELWIPKRYEASFGWAGIAIQDISEARDNFHADYFIGLMSDGLMTDRYAEINGFSLEDVDQGCTNDIESWRRYEPNSVIFCWKRKLITGDKCDVELVRDKPYMVKWALGPVIDGAIEQHSMRHMGLEYLVLSDLYLDNNEDERQTYGPWYNKHPNDLKWKNQLGSPFGPENFRVRNPGNN
ncbi:unnamed protein product [Blepharisma stoltei]|uniref:DOMON domain-containing protein n=1 Tax=Blepharisma stoltei TaxID=1481888 RepID=A0AAU9JK88_9CILI|nr:unnamed protein product [Blepharisma stoltei]